MTIKETRSSSRSLKADAYPKNGRIGWDSSWLGFLNRLLFNPEILHITATEDDVFINLVRRGNNLLRSGPAAFGTVRLDIFKRDGRLLGIDFIECANISVSDEKEAEIARNRLANETRISKDNYGRGCNEPDITLGNERNA